MSEKSRRIFHHLHQELSLLVKYNIQRMDLWEQVGSPMTLTHEEAVKFLEEEAPHLYDRPGLTKLTAKFKKWNPNVATPEEILTRLCK